MTAPPSASGPVNAGAPPAEYTWEATDQEVAEQAGIPLAQVVRFDLNTAPAPPEVAVRLLRSGEYGLPVSEYPPGDYRDLVGAAAERYGVATDEVLVGAGADEILDLIAKAFLPPGGRAVIPTPTYAMYRVLTEQRPAEAVLVPRLSPAQGFALDLASMRAAARDAAVVWLCSPNNPTGLPEPEGSIAALLDGLADDADVDGRKMPVVVLDEAYAEFAGRSLVGLQERHPRLVVVRTASKAYALAGMRVGFGLARRETLSLVEPYRPPGSVSVPSVAAVTAALRDPAILASSLERVERERARLAGALADLAIPACPSTTNFLLVDLGSPVAARELADALLRVGMVARTFGRDHPLAAYLRFTVRDESQDERLIAALGEIVPRLAGRHRPVRPSKQESV